MSRQEENTSEVRVGQRPSGALCNVMWRRLTDHWNPEAFETVDFNGFSTWSDLKGSILSADRKSCGLTALGTSADLFRSNTNKRSWNILDCFLILVLLMILLPSSLIVFQFFDYIYEGATGNMYRPIYTCICYYGEVIQDNVKYVYTISPSPPTKWHFFFMVFTTMPSYYKVDNI